MKWTWQKTVVVALVIIALTLAAFIIISTPMHQGGSAHKTSGNLGLVLGTPAAAHPLHMTYEEWLRKAKVRSWHHHFERVSTSSRAILAAIGPRYTIEGETHGDSWAINKVVQGICHFHITMSPTDHRRIMDKYSGASCDHRESWFWGLRYIEKTTGSGWTSTWCLKDGQQGPCYPVEYRYWRFTFQWAQGVDVLGQDIAHHSTQYVACTLRAGGTGWQCSVGDVS